MRVLRNLVALGIVVCVAGFATGPWALGGTEGRLDPSFHPHYSDGVVAEMHPLKDGRCLLLSTDGRLVALMNDGQPDSSFVADDTVYKVTMAASDSQDRIVCAGWQEYSGGYATVFRLDRNGQTDPTFDRNHEVLVVGGNGVTGVAVDRQDRVIVSGGWIRFDNRYQQSCVRLKSDGTLDPTFACPLSGKYFTEIVPLSNGCYLCSIGPSETNSGLVMLSADGSVVEDWVPDDSFSQMHTFVDAGNGKTLCIGTIRNTEGNLTRTAVVRLDTSGKEDPTFDRGFIFWDAGSLCLDASGRVYLAGRWADSTFEQVRRPGIPLGVARFNSDGRIDDTWPLELRGRGQARSITISSDGRLMIAGKILDFDGVRLQADESVWQDMVLALTNGNQPSARARNISSRGVVGPNGTAPVIVGFIADGNVPQRVLLRAVSGGLAQFGISDTLSSISAKLYRDGEVVATLRTVWISEEIAMISQSAGAFPVAGSFGDAVGVVTIPPGAYTLVITASSWSDTGGTVLGEVYFLD